MSSISKPMRQEVDLSILRIPNCADCLLMNGGAMSNASREEKRLLIFFVVRQLRSAEKAVIVSVVWSSRKRWMRPGNERRVRAGKRDRRKGRRKRRKGRKMSCEGRTGTHWALSRAFGPIGDYVGSTVSMFAMVVGFYGLLIVVSDYITLVRE